MSKIYPLLCILLLVVGTSYAQTQLKALPSNINRPSINLYAPFISGDGQTILYLSDYTDDGHHSMHWATKRTVSTWNDGNEVNKLINRPTLNFRGGYSLSFDGDQLFFSSQKAGLGGFDLWSSKRRGKDWEAPKNMGLPINSREDEGSPMLSPDGEYLYFMRCEQMKTYGGASGCKLYVSKLNYNGWSEPVALPDNINTGNSQTPRLLADGETLIFASDQMGGKGGLDLFMSKKTGENTYSKPIALDFANTPEDDAFVSIPAKGRYMFKDMKGARDNELVQVLIPEELQPKSVMRIQGKITDISGEPVNAQLTIFNIDARDRLWNEKVGKAGEFAIVLKEGAAYDLSVFHTEPNYMYFSKLYDLEEMGPRDKERLNIKLMPLKVGEEYPLDILFESHGSEVKEISTYELRRLGDFIRKTPSMQAEVVVEQSAYVEDTVQSDPDLTEQRIDTIWHEKPVFDMALVDEAYDSIMTLLSVDWPAQYETTIDSTIYQTTLTADSLIVKSFKIIVPKTPVMDSLSTDSLAVVKAPPMPADTLKASYPLIKYKTVTVYHNDRTSAQSQAIIDFLIDRGVKPEQISAKTQRVKKENPPEEEGSTIKVYLRLRSM
ncbi:MAG: hypothetical protein ABJH05_13430 [Fulvivirga sp.]